MEVLKAVLELHLVPSLQRVALRDMQAALGGMAEAWSSTSPATWEGAVRDVSGIVLERMGRGGGM